MIGVELRGKTLCSLLFGVVLKRVIRLKKKVNGSGRWEPVGYEYMFQDLHTNVEHGRMK